MGAPYIEANQASLRRLVELIERLGTGDLTRAVDNGWTIAQTLIHIAWWDNYARSLLESWRDYADGPFPSNSDAINDALGPILQLIAPLDATNFVRQSAESVDRTIEGLGADIVADVEARGFPRLLNRSLHRNAHLDQIAAALGRT